MNPYAPPREAGPGVGVAGLTLIPASPTARIAARLVELTAFFSTSLFTLLAAVKGLERVGSPYAKDLVVLLFFLVPVVVVLGHLMLFVGDGSGVGKRVYGLRVCALEGGVVATWRLLLRELLFYLALPTVLIPLIDLTYSFAAPQHQTLVDHLLGTQVMQVVVERAE